MSDQAQQELSNKPSPSPSPQRQSSDILSLQKELEDKRYELNIAYQTSLELIETNNELQQQFEEQCTTLQALDSNLIDYQMKIDLLERENQEYQQTINQTNDKYEELLGELAVTREHLNNAMNEITEYQTTIQSINHDIIHNTSDPPPASMAKHNQNNAELAVSEKVDYKEKLEKQQKKYDELLREHEKYRNEREQLVLLEIDYDEIKKEALKMEKRNKLLSDQIVDLTYSNVQLEKEINDYSLDIDDQNKTIQYLQNENQTLMTQKLNAKKSLIEKAAASDEAAPNKLSIESKKRLYSSYGGPDSILSTFVNKEVHKEVNKEVDTLKRRLSVQLRDNFGYNEKLVMFANNIDENGSVSDIADLQDGNDLFTMVQSYENNEEYLRNAEHHELDEINEESLSDLSDHQKQEEKAKEIEKESEKEEKSISPPKEFANKSREEKAVDPKPPKKSKSPRSQTRSGRRPSYMALNKKKRNFPRKKPVYRKTDALDEYLHLTASAVKINYPTVNATSQELITMVRSMPFYQAHDHLNRYMMDRLRWEQIQQNKLLQLKAAAIQSQRDHEIQQQSTVTRFFKKWFTTEYDDVDDIINSTDNAPRKGRVDLSTPLSKKENLRLNRVGKAKVRATKSGGTSVNIGSLNPNGVAPKGANRKKRMSKASGKSVRHRMNDHEQNRRQKQRDQQLKTLSITQTLPSSKLNNKNVQKMLEINAEYIDKVIQTESQKQDKNKKKPTIRVTVPVKGAKDDQKIQNAEEPKKAQKPQKLLQAPKDAKKPKKRPKDGKKRRKSQGAAAGRKKAPQQRAKARRKIAAPPSQKQGWFSWLAGAEQQPPPQYRGKHKPKPKGKKAREQAFVADPYALAPNNNVIQVKKKTDKKKAKQAVKKQVDDDKKVDINENIRKVVEAQEAEQKVNEKEQKDVVLIDDKKEQDAKVIEEETAVEDVPVDNNVKVAAVPDVMGDNDANESEEEKEPEQNKEDAMVKEEVVNAPQAIDISKVEDNVEEHAQNDNIEAEMQNDDEEEDVRSPISPLSPSVPSLITANDMSQSIDDLASHIQEIPLQQNDVISAEKKEEEDSAQENESVVEINEDEASTEKKVEEDIVSTAKQVADPYAMNIESMAEISLMEVHHTPLPEDRNSDDSNPLSIDIDIETKPQQQDIHNTETISYVIENNLDDNSDDLDDILLPAFDQEADDDHNKNDIPQNINADNE